MSVNIYISRHGQNEDNKNGILNGHRDEPLTDLGIRQAEDLARHLVSSKLVFSEIYSSPLCRAYETADTVAKALGASSPIKHPLLIERNFGVMTGKSVNDIVPMCGDRIVKTSTITYFLDPEGAETFDQLIERARLLLAHIHIRHPEGSVLLVCHGDIGKMIFAEYYKVPWMEVLTDFHFGNSELLLLSENCSAKDAHVFKMEQHSH